MRACLSRYVAFASPIALVLGLMLLQGVPVSARADSSSSAPTTLYRWVDAQGVIHFSDTPQPGAQKIEVSPAQTFPSAPSQGTETVAPAAQQQIYQTCEISQPTAEQSFYAPEVIGISVRLVPDLRAGDQLSMSVDGHGISSIEGSALDFELPMPDRGAHTLQAVVRDAEGHTLCSSSSITFYVQRPSLLSPQSPAATRGSSGVRPIPHH